MKKKLIILAVSMVFVIGGVLLALSTTKGYFNVNLPILGYVQNFNFTDQDGDVVTNNTVDDKVYVAEYFYTTCTGLCPKMNANMTGVYNKFKNDTDFAIISHTSMPEVDSVPKLKEYEKRMIGDETNGPAKWYFVTGSKDSLYKIARQSYHIDDPDNIVQNPGDDFIHSQFFALVDKQKRVRGIYDGLKKDEIASLEKDITKLLKEND